MKKKYCSKNNHIVTAVAMLFDFIVGSKYTRRIHDIIGLL